ncbi:MAG: ribosomal protein S18-alanine N-acetyltransferase [Pseudomonadota bacterium]
MSKPLKMPEEVRFRLARVSDSTAIAEMSRDLIEHGLPWRWQPSRIYTQIRCPENQVVVAATKNEQIVGFAITRFGEDEAHLFLLAVDPTYRRTGLGRQLVKWFEKSAQIAGIAQVYLEVRAKNQGARLFYRSLGYRELALIPLYYSGREAAIRMVHDLHMSVHS